MLIIPPFLENFEFTKFEIGNFKNFNDKKIDQSLSKYPSWKLFCGECQKQFSFDTIPT
jgi:hypothetical protein